MEEQEGKKENREKGERVQLELCKKGEGDSSESRQTDRQASPCMEWKPQLPVTVSDSRIKHLIRLLTENTQT